MLAYSIVLPVWEPAWWVRLCERVTAWTPIPAERPAEDPIERTGLPARTRAVSRHKGPPSGGVKCYAMATCAFVLGIEAGSAAGASAPARRDEQREGGEK